MLVNVNNVDTLQPIKSHANTLFVFHIHSHIEKQILSKYLLLQEIVKALAGLSECVVFVNT